MLAYGKDTNTMLIRKAETQDQIKHIQELYMEAFPANERKPFELMLEKCAEGSMEMLVIETENGTFLGMAIFVIHNSMVLLDYFAIKEQERGQGIGSCALKILQTYYPEKRFFLEIEDIEVLSDNQEERIRRRDFYLKNDMTIMPFKVDLFGVVMEVLAYRTKILPEEYMSLYIGVFSHKIADKVKICSGEN